jgi:hypothetical protein
MHYNDATVHTSVKTDIFIKSQGGPHPVAVPLLLTTNPWSNVDFLATSFAVG